jgi:hypothetical protein
VLWIRGCGGFRRQLAAFLTPVLLAVCVQAAYNAARFGSPFDDGLVIQIQTTGDPRLRERYAEHGMFDARYVLDNLRLYLANFHLPRDPAGRLTYDPMGQSLFLVTPPILFAFLAGRHKTRYTRALVLGIAPFVAALLFYFASGYAQFGNRYLLEAMPFLLLLVATGMGPRIGFAAYGSIVLAIAANAFGTFRFCERYFARVEAAIPPWSLAAFVAAALLARVVTDRRSRATEAI